MSGDLIKEDWFAEKKRKRRYKSPQMRTRLMALKSPIQAGFGKFAQWKKKKRNWLESDL